MFDCHLAQSCLLLAMTRGEFLLSSAVVQSSITSMSKDTSMAFLPSNGGGGGVSKEEYSNTRKLSVDEAIFTIHQHTPPDFIKAVSQSQKLLYRGEEDFGSTCLIMAPEPDLLFFDTYSNDQALEYFTQLERCLRAAEREKENQSSSGKEKEFIVRPSNGHIGTPSSSEAARWGTAVSIWPLGSQFSYSYPKDRTLFFDETNPIDGLTIRSCQLDVEYNRRLNTALTMGKEVMFSSLSAAFPDSSFLAIPSKYDDKLLAAICSIPPENR
mmetsp:Transcript_19427/g.29408  ORF Transcript_19427/g.29408 Transcript_19427/m.29408 type:complete len:269 (-) Transcript_19427:39-845(-)